MLVTMAADHDAALAALPPRIVLYDGVCGLCNRAVQFLLRVDRGRALMYAPLQGETAAALRTRHREITEKIDTVAYVEDGRAYVRSRAFVRLSRHLPYPWKLASWLWIVPSPLADLVYRLVAAVRYRVFGKYDSCRIPDPDERARFLA
jgi:predicted DCC family thiol-disulfide oxidoreductase YuxK